MLQHLTISNYALIDRTDLDLDAGMSVITGETGAGKSIMLGALGMLLGQKTDAQVLLDKTQKCVVEATFDIAAYNLQSIFEEADVEYDDITIVRREILPSGKARAFVNDSPVTVGFLKEIGARLVDIHSQHQNMLLSQSSFHLDVVDAVAQDQADLGVYAEAYEALHAKETELHELRELNERQGRELDYDRHLLSELENAKLQDPNEIEALEHQQQMQDKAEDIKNAIAFAVTALDADETGVLTTLHEAQHRLEHVADFLPKDDKVLDRIESARIDLDDILKTLGQLAEDVNFDPEEQQKVNDRLNILNGLAQKHRVQTVAELIATRDEIKSRVDAVDSFDDRLAELTKLIADLRADAMAKAEVLTTKRLAVFDAIASHVEAHLHQMGMSNARFIIQHKRVELGPVGQDDIHFLFSANKNGEPTDIARVASGGEMSRVMLSIKSLLSKSKSLPTIIFDEIDTGVSGDVADKMGRIMAEMAQHMQVLAITHLPQVASRGAKHYRVYKEDTTDRTISHITLLNPTDRVTELAKMLSGEHITDAAMANARELLANAGCNADNNANGAAQ